MMLFWLLLCFLQLDSDPKDRNDRYMIHFSKLLGLGLCAETDDILLSLIIILILIHLIHLLSRLHTAGKKISGDTGDPLLVLILRFS